MNNFNLKKRSLSSGPHLIGSLLILAGVLVLISPLIFEQENSVRKILGVGFGVIVAGLAIVSSYEGTQFNFTEKSYKEYSSIFGFIVGDWTKLPVITETKLISKSYNVTNKPNGISPTFSGEVTDYRLLIYSSSDEPEFSFVYNSKKKALKHAKILSANLGAELILDITEQSE